MDFLLSIAHTSVSAPTARIGRLLILVAIFSPDFENSMPTVRTYLCA
ncbi:unnamed protein product, partial [Callosobruchus maculatus]